ncbi:MAG TPA: ABC transporter permease, partial [Polyangiaceae bacterium]
MRSKKRAFVSVGTMFAVLGVALGVGALATVISVTGGFRAQFREKVLGVNAHVLILKYSSDFREYRKLMDEMRGVPGVIGIAPFVISPMMVTHGDRTATGVLLKGVDPERVSQVLDLPQHIVEGKMEGLRLPGAKPPERRRQALFDDLDLDRGPSDAGDTKAPLVIGSAEPDASAAPERPRKSPLRDFNQILKDAANGEPDMHSRASVDLKGSAKPVTSADDADDKLPPGAPVGNIVPEGGYKSKLPDDDILPEDLQADPCSDPASTKNLPGIIIGVTLKQNLEVGLGDCIRVTSPTIGFTYSRGAMRA